MKKILIIFVILMFVFSTSCVKKETENILTTQNNVNQYSGPQIVFTTFSVLYEIKSALNRMNPESFVKYMEENHDNLVMNGMYDYESTNRLLNELESTTVLLLGDENLGDNEFSFYHERNEVQLISYFTEEKRAGCYAFTPKNETNSDRDLEKNENLTFEKEIIKDGVIARIYSSSYENRGYHAEIKVDGTYIYFWINEKQTIEEFEADFERIKLIKIADILDKYTEISTETDAVLHIEE